MPVFGAWCVVTVTEKPRDLTITNNTDMFKAVSARLEDDETGTVLVMALSSDGYHYLFKGTYDEAVANGDNRDNWIEYSINADGKYEFRIPVAEGESYIPVVAISNRYLEKYEQGQNSLERAFYPRQLTVDAEALTLVTDNFKLTQELVVTNNVSMFKVSAAALDYVSGPNSNDFKADLILTMGSESFDKAYVGDADDAAAAETVIPLGEGSIFEFPIKWEETAGKPETLKTLIGEPFIMSFHSVNKDAWYEREFTISETEGTLVINNAPEAAPSEEVYVTISNVGVLALARAAVTVKDINRDGMLSYDEALVAAHKAYCPGGYETEVVSNYFSVNKLWNVSNGGFYLFYRNDVMADSVDRQEVAAGDDLVAAVMKDTERYSDHYTYFTDKALSGTTSDTFTLTLKADVFGTPSIPAGVSIGTWEDGTFTQIGDKTVDENGNVELTFAEPGTYYVSAGGTMSDEVTVDFLTHETQVMACPITAPLCIIKVNPTPAEDAEVYVTISSEGLLALARAAVTVKDIDKDGMLSYDEALVAAHEAFCPGGYEAELVTSEYGDYFMVSKLWNVSNGGSYLFYRNNMIAETVNVQEVKAGDDLVAAVMKDTEHYSDHYAYFTPGSAKITVDDALTLTLKTDSYGSAPIPVGVSVGIWKDGTFTPIEGKTIGEDGSVELTFDEKGTYYISAKGTVSDSVVIDWHTEESEVMDCPITAPLCVVTVTQTTFDGEGTEEDPFRIRTPEDMQTLDRYVEGGKTFKDFFLKMEDDIVLDADFNGVGADGKPFSGDFDGDGHLLTVPEGGTAVFTFVREASIHDLDVFGSRIDDYGLVSIYKSDSGVTSVVVFDNVTLKSGTKTLKAGFIGGYAGGSNLITIRNSKVEDGVTIGYTKDQDWIGSFGGEFNGTISNCVSHATVYGHDFVGGIVANKGQTMGTFVVDGCTFEGTVQATGNFVGGIVGAGYGGTRWGMGSAWSTPGVTITNCFAKGKISGAKGVGGILGGEGAQAQAWDNGPTTVEGNRFTGTVSGSDFTGGIIGYILSINKYTHLSGNSFSGNYTEIGGVGAIDTSAHESGMFDGVYYFNTSTEDGRPEAEIRAEIAGHELQNVINVTTLGSKGYANQFKLDHNLTGDPLQIKVKFSVLGDEPHEVHGDEDKHGMWLGGLTEWMAETEVEVTSGATAWDVISKAFDADDTMTLTANMNPQYGSYYISAVTKGDLTLTEKDNFAASGWMYTVNGKHPEVGVSLTIMKDGDEVILHWADDYLLDEAARPIPDEERIAEVEALIDEIAEAETPEEKQEAIAAAKEAYDKLPNELKEQVENRQDLLDLLGGGLHLDTEDFTLVGGKTKTITATDDEGTKLTDVLWSVETEWAAREDEDVVTVDKGVVKAMSVGEAKITATHNGETATVTVTTLFSDVADPGHYSFEPVYWAAKNGITTGTSATEFAPNNPCSRGQIVTFLWRAYGSPEPTLTTNPFKDVKEGAYYYEAVLWAVEKNITTGTSATTFAPNDPCTRKQIVTFMWRAEGSPEPTSDTNPFKDVKSSDYFYKAVLWAVEKKITTGTSATTFAPNDKCTRAQCVTFLMRAVG